MISVERLDRQAGPYRVTGTVTRVWDLEVAARIKAMLVDYMLAQAPEILAGHRAQLQAEELSAGGDSGGTGPLH